MVKQYGLICTSHMLRHTNSIHVFSYFPMCSLYTIIDWLQTPTYGPKYIILCIIVSKTTHDIIQMSEQLLRLLNLRAKLGSSFSSNTYLQQVLFPHLEDTPIAGVLIWLLINI